LVGFIINQTMNHMKIGENIGLFILMVSMWKNVVD